MVAGETPFVWRIHSLFWTFTCDQVSCKLTKIPYSDLLFYVTDHFSVQLICKV